MKKNRIYAFINLMAVVLTIVLAGSAFAGGSAEKATPPQNSNYVFWGRPLDYWLIFCM